MLNYFHTTYPRKFLSIRRKDRIPDNEELARFTRESHTARNENSILLPICETCMTTILMIAMTVIQEVEQGWMEAIMNFRETP